MKRTISNFLLMTTLNVGFVAAQSEKSPPVDLYGDPLPRHQYTTPASLRLRYRPVR